MISRLATLPLVEGRNAMRFRTVAKVAIISLSIWQAASAQSWKEANTPMQSQTEPRTRARAKAKITVQSSEAKPYDQTASPALMEINLHERFTGDIDGESPVRALQVLRDDKSACLVSMQRFRGKLGGREGTFVLQGSEIVENGKIKATWFVVPGSGTGDLSRLRGEGGFEGDFGKGSDGWLDYWFE
jgi:uncharacterized protein DUF3224